MKKLILALFMVSLAAWSGCQTAHKATKPAPAQVTAFLPEPQKLKEQKPTFPFNKLWFDDGFDWRKYNKIVVAPVDTEHLLKQDWWKKLNEQKAVSDPKKDCITIGNYMRKAFQTAVREDPQKRFAVVDAPEPGALILELALVDLVPTKAFLNAVETVVGFVIFPVAFLTTLNSGSVAMEGRIKDVQTGKIVCMFTDRENGSFAIIDAAGLTWYRHAENIIQEWSRNFVAIANSEDYLKVKRKFPFKPVAW